MNSLANTAARFLPKRKFRSGLTTRARAFLTAGYPRQGGGSFIRRSTKLRHAINIAHEAKYVDFFYKFVVSSVSSRVDQRIYSSSLK